MKLSNVFLVATALLVFSGCASHQNVTQTFTEKSKEFKELKDDVTLKSQIKEVVKPDSFVVTKNKLLSEALQEISALSNTQFLLQGEDMPLPYVPSYKNIHDFNSLKIFIEDTTNKTIRITKNKFVKNRIRTVRLIDKEAIGKDFKNKTFKLTGQDLDLRESLKRFSEKTGFTVVYNNKIKSTSNGTENSNSDNAFKVKLINYQCVNAQQFIEYLRYSLNFYIDIDYVNKMCKIEKYRLKEIPLIISNRTISKSGSSEISSSSEASSTAETSSGMQSKIELSVYDALETTIKDLVTNINTKSGDSNYVSLDKNTGIVSIYATNDAMKIISAKIKNFNKSYMETGYVTLTVFELIVENKQDIGSNINYSNKGSIKNSTIGVNTNNISDTVNSIITFANMNAKGTKTLDIIANSLNEIGHILKKTEYGSKIRNHVPSSLKELRVTNYVKNAVANVETGTASTTTTSSTETAELVSGSDGVLIPKFDGDEASIYVSLSDTVVESITKETYGTTEINIPITKPRTIDDEYIIKRGESTIVKRIDSYEDADSYKGIVPIKNFLIGGENNKNIVKKELLYVLTLDD